MLHIHISGYSVTSYHKIELSVWQDSRKTVYINYNIRTYCYKMLSPRTLILVYLFAEENNICLLNV